MQRFGAQAELVVQILREDLFPADFIGALQDLVDVDRLEAELQLALADAGDVEQVVDQAGLQLDVAADDGRARAGPPANPARSPRVRRPSR